jgi:hypothetical protein
MQEEAHGRTEMFWQIAKADHLRRTRRETSTDLKE